MPPLNYLKIVRLPSKDHLICQSGHAARRLYPCTREAKYQISGKPLCVSHVFSKVRNMFSRMSDRVSEDARIETIEVQAWTGKETVG